MSVLLSIDALNAHHGQLPAVRNVSLQVRQGDILLGDGKFEDAIGRFEAALAVSPAHRGARGPET